MGFTSPLPSDLAGECKKAAKILNSFIDPLAAVGPDKMIPPNIIANAKGLAIFTVVKAGFLFSGRAGSGLVVARLADGGWSAPSCIGVAGMGVGGQIGAEITDFVCILNTKDAVKTFSQVGNVTLGGNISVAAGPIGRQGEVAGSTNLRNIAAIYSYSKTKGLFAGASIEGSIIATRGDANEKFYGRKVTPSELLSGSVAPPPQADPLYRALNARVNRTGVPSAPAGGPTGSMYNSTPVYGEDASEWAGQTRRTSSTGPSAAPAVSRPPFSPYSQPPPSYSSSTTNPPNAFEKRTYPAPARAQAPPPRPPPPPRRPKEPTAVALYDFAGEQPGDLPFHQGDIIVITRRTESQNDWWEGRCNGKEGSFPANYCRVDPQ
ncbi:uncharacterized protein VTP21DRAFT_9881 [Calcarisporiella thermophila]|uniref:uncharacterized protein n=1 Tax=Calcarisporiella thermophila TaxID=911321 RepID=UPI0037441722